MTNVPAPIRAYLGLMDTAMRRARDLADRAPELPMEAVAAAMQFSLKAQQRFAEFTARGDDVLGRIRGVPDEPPSWATFDDDQPADSSEAFAAADVSERGDGDRERADRPAQAGGAEPAAPRASEDEMAAIVARAERAIDQREGRVGAMASAAPPQPPAAKPPTKRAAKPAGGRPAATKTPTKPAAKTAAPTRAGAKRAAPTRARAQKATPTRAGAKRAAPTRAGAQKATPTRARAQKATPTRARAKKAVTRTANANPSAGPAANKAPARPVPRKAAARPAGKAPATKTVARRAPAKAVAKQAPAKTVTVAASRRRGPSVASADPRTPTGRGRTTIRRADALGDDLRADTARQLSAFDLVADPAPDAG